VSGIVFVLAKFPAASRQVLVRFNADPGIISLASVRLRRLICAVAEVRGVPRDFHHMVWAPDGKVMAVAVGNHGSIWKFTPEGR